jgi:GTPase Era involved in 16S rRNA processing
VVNRGDTQFVFVDTPGFHKPKNRLDDFMSGVVKESVCDVDAVLLYSETDSLTAVRAKAEALMAQGKTVLVQRQMPENIRCKEVLNM